MNERKNPAARTARSDALQALRGGVAEMRRKIRDDKKVIFFRNTSGFFVVFGDRRIFVSQIHLDHFFDMLAKLREPFLDLIALRPDAAIDDAFLIIGKVHQPRKILSKPDRINNREADFSGRRFREKPENNVV